MSNLYQHKQNAKLEINFWSQTNLWYRWGTASARACILFIDNTATASRQCGWWQRLRYADLCKENFPPASSRVVIELVAVAVAAFSSGTLGIFFGRCTNYRLRQSVLHSRSFGAWVCIPCWRDFGPQNNLHWQPTNKDGLNKIRLLKSHLKLQFST